MSRPPAAPGAVPAARGDVAAGVSRPAALVLLVLVSVVWGAHWSVVKVGLRTMPPLTYATLRVGSGLVVVLVLLAVQGRLRPPPRADLPVVASVGLVQIALGIVVMNLGLTVVTAGRASVLVYSMPIWVALLLLVRGRGRPRTAELVGLVVGSVGLGLLGAPALARAGAGEALGVAVLLLGAVTWAWATIHVREHRWTASTWELQPWQLLVGLVPLSVVALVVEQGRGIAWDTTTVLVLLYSGPLATAFGFWAILTVTRVLGPLAAGVGFLAVPVVGLITGWLVLGERLGAIDAAASALVLVGIAATSLGEDAVPSDAAGATHP
ncbi:MAG: hypothetical protein RLZZ272_1038 [Actinomycetota bacterium]